ncbi:peptide chain release factor N(5)-glutamine methyltransferase [bacterium]|nr:peptide chain release factor N(5)-glutamine methyltransferase [bacterium]
MIKKVEEILKQNGIEEYKAEAKMLVLELSNLTLEEILSGKSIENPEKILNAAQERATTKAPIQHILGYSYFMGEKYIINSNVLIPRDETEILVNKAYELIKNNKNKIDILDIGVGSGCISCALAKKLKEKDIEILGVDISLEALEIAIENINKLDLVRKIVLRKSDIYSKIRPIEKFDLIVSNPPYIPINQKESLQQEVKNFDPEIALFAPDNDGVEFYEKIIKEAKNCLKPNGYIAFELGINQANLVSDMLEKDFKNIEITKDLAGIERVINAQLK